MLARIVLALASFAAPFFAQGVQAMDREAALTLPALAPCANRSHPLLPEKWHGTYLMAPFNRAQLMLGDIVYDGSIPAMRVRLAGVRAGSTDLFVRARNTYLLAHDGSSAVCQDLGDTGWRPLPRDWLALNAKCEGSAPVGGLALDWWKTPSGSGPSANWIWYRTDGRSPFRLMFAQPSDKLAVLSWYSFSYQVRFESLPDSGLAAIAASCETKKPNTEEAGRARLQKIVTDMERSPFRDDAGIAALMPELEAACPPAPLPSWPEHAAMTALMTSPDFNNSPMPTEVLYDGSRKLQRTRNFWPATSHLATDDALLLDGHGYSVARTRAGGLICTAALPGALRPNWPESGGCSCEASIKGNTALTPFGPARILVCPMTGQRVVWSWFARDGRPMVFMETSEPGDGTAGVLTLVDYHAWQPDRAAGIAAFDTPAQCAAPRPAAAASPASLEASSSGSRRCSACHLDGAPRR